MMKKVKFSGQAPLWTTWFIKKLRFSKSHSNCSIRSLIKMKMPFKNPRVSIEEDNPFSYQPSLKKVRLTTWSRKGLKEKIKWPNYNLKKTFSGQRKLSTQRTGYRAILTASISAKQITIRIQMRIIIVLRPLLRGSLGMKLIMFIWRPQAAKKCQRSLLIKIWPWTYIKSFGFNKVTLIRHRIETPSFQKGPKNIQ